MENTKLSKNKRHGSVRKHVKLPLTKGISIKPKNCKLILHFDVRNTILVADSVTDDNIEEALNSYFTGVTWGKTPPRGGNGRVIHPR